MRGTLTQVSVKMTDSEEPYSNGIMSATFRENTSGLGCIYFQIIFTGSGCPLNIVKGMVDPGLQWWLECSFLLYVNQQILPISLNG